MKTQDRIERLDFLGFDPQVRGLLLAPWLGLVLDNLSALLWTEKQP